MLSLAWYYFYKMYQNQTIVIIVDKNRQTYNIWSIASENIEEVGEQNTTQPDGVTLS